MSNLNKEELYDLLYNLKDEFDQLYIVEDYRIFPGKQMQHTMAKLLTAEVIGAIDYISWVTGSKVVLQKPADKIIGYKWSGMKPPSDHSKSHCYDALAHGIYYLCKEKYIDPPIKEYLSKRES